MLPFGRAGGFSLTAKFLSRQITLRFHFLSAIFLSSATPATTTAWMYVPWDALVYVYLPRQLVELNPALDLSQVVHADRHQNFIRDGRGKLLGRRLQGVEESGLGD